LDEPATAAKALQDGLAATSRHPELVFELASLELLAGRNEVAQSLLHELRGSDPILLSRCLVRAFGLGPYDAWNPTPLPGSGRIATEAIARGLADIVQTEGPILLLRGYRLYARASGHVSFTPGLLDALRGGTAMAVERRMFRYLSRDVSQPLLSVVDIAAAGNAKERLSTPRLQGPRAEDEILHTEITALEGRIKAKFPGCPDGTLTDLVKLCYGASPPKRLPPLRLPSAR
jgi:hypothetical protein